MEQPVPRPPRMHARALLACGLLLLLACAPLAAQTLRVGGGAGRVFDRDALVASVGGSTTLRVLEPHESVQRGYVGVAAVPLLDALFGDEWRRAGSIEFECADGYRALIAPSDLLSHDAVLAYGTADGAPFRLTNRLQDDEPVALAPWYLVWDNLHAPALQAQGASGWPYQVVGIALLDPQSDLARTLPPLGLRSDPAVQRGMAAFRTHCIACHSINGQGGDKAPELNHPVSVTEWIAPVWLRRWMLAPATVRHGTPMPGLPAGLPERAAVADAIVAYLRAVSGTRWEPEPAG